MIGYVIINEDGRFFSAEYEEETKETAFYYSKCPSIFKNLDEVKEIKQEFAKNGCKVKILKMTLECINE